MELLWAEDLQWFSCNHQDQVSTWFGVMFWLAPEQKKNINSYFSSYSFPGELEPMGAGLHPGKENCREIVQMHNPVKVRIYFVLVTKDP